MLFKSFLLRMAYLIVLFFILFQQSSPLHSQTWQDLTGPWKANVTDLAIGRASGASAPILYEADGSDLYRRDDGANSWEKKTQPGGTIIAVTCMPNDPSKVIAATDTYLWYNANSGGGTWTQKIHDSNVHPTRLAASPANPLNMLLGLQKECGQKTIRRSTDGGVTWLDDSNLSGAIQTSITAVAWLPSDATIAFAGGTALQTTCSQQSESPSPDYTQGIFRSTNSGQDWSNYGNLTKNIVAIAAYVSSSITYVLAGTDDGSNKLYRTSNGGGTWSPCTLYTGGLINDIKVDQNNKLWITASDGVYWSTNNGTNWTATNCDGFYAPNDMKRVAVDPGNASTVFVGNPTTIFKTTNGGTSWSDVASGSSRMSTQAVAVNNKTVIALSTTNAVTGKNTDGGSTWVNGGLDCSTDFRGLMTAFKTTAGSVAFAAGYHQGSGSTTASLWRSTNSGSSPWTEVRSGSNTSGKFNGVLIDPLNTERIYVFGKKEGNDNLSVSNDGGSSWERVCIPDNNSSSDPEISDMILDATVGTSNSQNVYASVYTSSTASQQGVWKSTNAGSSWYQLGVNPSDPLIYNSNGTGKSVRAMSMAPYTPSKLFAAGDSSGAHWMRMSEDGGSTWKTITAITSQVTKILQHPSYPNYLYVVSGGGTTVQKNTYGGYQSWTDITGSLPTPIYDLRSSSNAGYLYAATASGIYKLNIEPAAPANISGGIEYETDKPRISWTANQETDVITGGIYKVHRSLQSCHYISPTKTTCGSYGPDELIGSTTGTYFIDENFGVYAEPETYFTRAAYYVLAVDEGNLYSGASGTVYYDGILYDANKTVHRELLDETKPELFALDANYPNPFNPSTQITYALPEDVYVTLKVYSIPGQEVAVLIDEQQTAGYKSVNFDANSAAGGLPSGMYFYTITAGNFSQTGKMMLVK